MYVTVVQMVVFYCNVSECFSAVYYALCNLFNTPPCLVPAKAACHLRQRKHHSKFAGGFGESLKSSPNCFRNFKNFTFCKFLVNMSAGFISPGTNISSTSLAAM